MLNLAKPSTLLKLILAVAALYAIILYFIFNIPTTATWGFNKTVGWAWDICFVMPIISFFAYIIIFIFYMILAVIKAKLNKTITLLSFIFLVLMPGVVVIAQNCIFGIMIVFLLIALMFMNIGFAIGNKIPDKSGTQ